jgi:prolyl-tRNA editing enzyme YbaK/EbsC (Cys-tRNA(Pro) deacylase)
MASRETLATKAARAARIAFEVHEYAHDPRAESYGREAATALSLEPARVFKTLVVHETIYVSAGRRGLEIELAPRDLVALTSAEVRPLRRA